MDESTIQVGLLLDTAQTHQKLADASLQRLESHTRGLDAVIRDAIARSITEELRTIRDETQHTLSAFVAVQRRVNRRLIALAAAVVAAAVLQVLLILLH